MYLGPMSTIYDVTFCENSQIFIAVLNKPLECHFSVQKQVQSQQYNTRAVYKIFMMLTGNSKQHCYSTFFSVIVGPRNFHKLEYFKTTAYVAQNWTAKALKMLQSWFSRIRDMGKYWSLSQKQILNYM